MYGCWLTVNRSCNIRCKWCYATGTGFKKNDNMDFDSAKKLVDFCENLKVKDIILIGGEPTIYPYILDLISYISKKGITTVLVTNGIIFSQKNNIEKYINAGLNSFSISLKANSQTEYLEVTGKDCFSNVISCIKNLRELNANFSVSQVLTAENIPTLSNGLKIFKEAGAKNFSFDFCHNFVCSNVKDDNFIKNNNPYIVPKLKEAMQLYNYTDNDFAFLIVYKSKIYQINEDYTVFNLEHALAIGSGSTAIRLKLSKLNTNDDIESQILEALRFSAQYNSAVGAPFRLVNTKDLKTKIVEE